MQIISKLAYLLHEAWIYNFYVSNVPKTVAFYETAFDLKRWCIHESHLYDEMEIGRTALAFAGNDAAEMAGLGLLPNDPRTVAAGWEICMIISDVAKAYDEAIFKGCSPVAPPTEKLWEKNLRPDSFLSARFERLPC